MTITQTQPQPRTNSTTHHVGLVGLAQAQHFVEMFRRIPGVEVIALCDLELEKLTIVGDKHGITRQYVEFEAMLRSDVDAVVLSTPIQVHGQQAIAAMRAGKHVLCQYVAAMNPDEARALLDAAGKTGAKYMTIETDCYEERNMVMMALARKGVFGELTTGRGYYIHDCKSLGRNPDGSLTWRGQFWNSMLGGRNAAVHNSLPLLKCFGERVAEVFAYGTGARTAPEYKMHDRVTIVARLRSGRVLEFVTDILSPHPHVFGYQLQGTRGCWEFDQAYLVEGGRLSAAKTVTELEEEYGLTEVIPDLGQPGGHGLSWEGIIRRFIHSIDRDERPPEDLFDALEMTAIGWAAEESLATGRTVQVMSFE